LDIDSSANFFNREIFHINISNSNGKLTSATVLLGEQPAFYEKPRFSRRLVKRLVILPFLCVFAFTAK